MFGRERWGVEYGTDRVMIGKFFENINFRRQNREASRKLHRGKD